MMYNTQGLGLTNEAFLELLLSSGPWTAYVPKKVARQDEPAHHTKHSSCRLAHQSLPKELRYSLMTVVNIFYFFDLIFFR